MKWPWVTRLAYEAVVREDDDLRREQVRLHGEIELLHQEIERLHGDAEKLVSRLAYETIVGERDQLREQVGEMVQVRGYWEDNEFKAAQVTRLADGETIVLRDDVGRPHQW